MNRQKELELLIKKYDEAYYNQQETLISDQEYDKLKEEYLRLIGEENDFVSGKINSKDKVKHTFRVSSLAKIKANEIDKLRKELEKLFPVIIQPKLDGISMVDYGNTFVSRGGGEYGENKQDKKKYINGIGKYFGMPVRGECVILKDDFKHINKQLIKDGLEPFKNERNAISGMMNRKDNIPQGVTFVAYYVHGIDNPQEQISLLRENGYNCVDYYIPKDIDEAINYLQTFDFNSLPYLIDGLVVKSLQDKDFGETAHHPLNAFAFKRVCEGVETELLDIEFNVGKTGICSPRAKFNPVDIDGSTIEYATLHNIDYIKALGIDKTCNHVNVTVIKSNDVIPRIISADVNCNNGVNVNIKIPTTCPECGRELENVNGILYCRNQYCKEKVIAQAVNMCSKNCLDIRGLSEETIRKMYDVEKEYSIHRDNINFTFPLYYTYDLLLQLEGFAEKSAKKLVDEIQNKRKNVSFERFLASCNIPLLGNNTAKLISKNFKNLSDLYEDIYINNNKKLLSINGIGEELCNSLDDNWDNVDLLFNLIENIIYEEESNTIIDSPIKDKTFVITGDVQHFKNRKELQNKIESLGGKVTGSVSKKTDFLVNNDMESSSSKNKKAKELGVKIITEDDFIEMIREM